MTPEDIRESCKKLPETGVFCLTNTVTGRVLIGSAIHLPVYCKRMRAELCMGLYRHPRLQADWTRYGESAFRLEPLEEYVPQDPDDIPAVSDALRALEAEWAKKMDGHPQYNRVVV